MLRLSIIGIFLTLSAAAQNRTWEVGGLLGTSSILGEMGGDEKEGRPFIGDLQWKNTGASFGAYLRYRLNPYMAVRTNVIYGRISGADSTSGNVARNLRNLHFKSHLIEASQLFELLIFQFPGRTGFQNVVRYANSAKVRGSSIPQLSVNIFMGAGLAHFNPKAKYGDTWYALQPLGTEGQGSPAYPDLKKYCRTTLVLPAGVEAFFSTHPNVYKIGLEIGWRYTTTDYLDDVSTDYADSQAIAAANGPIAAILANRTGEVTNGEGHPSFKPGEKRGDPANHDTYIFTMSNLTIFLNGKQPAPKYNRISH